MDSIDYKKLQVKLTLESLKPWVDIDGTPSSSENQKKILTDADRVHQAMKSYGDLVNE